MEIATVTWQFLGAVLAFSVAAIGIGIAKAGSVHKWLHAPMLDDDQPSDCNRPKERKKAAEKEP